MRSSTLAYMMIFLMTLSVTPLSGFSGTPDEANNNSSESDLEPIKIDLSAEGRQSTVETAHWDYDTTTFAMFASSESSDGSAGIEYHPCQEAYGWRDSPWANGGSQYDSQIPHMRWYFQPNLPIIYDNDQMDCFSWDTGTAGATVSDFSVNTGDGTTEHVPEHTSHDAGRFSNHMQWDGYQQESTYDGYLDSDNILDFDVDRDGNSYIVGSWDGNRLVFPNVVGSHVYLDNSGMTAGGSDFVNFGSNSHVDENHDQDIFVAKMDSNGQWLWATSIYHYGVDSASSIAVSNGGDAYIGGTIQCSEGNSVTFPDLALSENTGSDPAGIVHSCNDAEPAGFVASLDTNGAFTDAKVIENKPVFSSVTDVALDNKNDNTLYFIGKMGACSDKTGCPGTSDSYMIGKMKTDTMLQPATWKLDWLDFVNPNVVLTEIEMTINGAVITGFTDESAQVGTVSVIENSIIVAKIGSEVTATGDISWDWVKSCDPPSMFDDWAGSSSLEGFNPSWGLSVSSTHIAMLVEPGTQCGAMESNFYGFQAVSLDLDGNWAWSNGDAKDTSNLPPHYQFSNDAHATDLDYANNGDAIISVNLGKMVRVNGTTFLPKNGTSDILMLRLDDDTGSRIWHWQEVNKECSNPASGYSLTASNICPDSMRGGADARRIVVKDLDDIYMSGMIYGKEIYLHDGLPEHCDYNYAEPYWQDASGQYVSVPQDLAGSIGFEQGYVSKCAVDAGWLVASGDSTYPPEQILPQHGTQWHGGNPYFAKFDACPVLVGSIIAVDEQLVTAGRTDWYVSPAGEPTNVDNTRYDCDSDGTYLDPQPNIDIYGCTDVYAMNYDATATIDDGSCVYDTDPNPIGGTGAGLDPCACNPLDSIANMTELSLLSSLHVMEITSPTSGGSPQGSNAGFYHLEFDFVTNLVTGGILSTRLTDAQMIDQKCDLFTSAKECYDFYTSDEYGNYDAFGEYIAIKTYNPYLHAGNIDAVWLEMTDGTNHYASDIVYFNHGNAPPGTSLENEILGQPTNDPSVNPIVNPTGFTALGPQFTTIVLCFDTAPPPVVVIDDASNDDDDDDDNSLPSISLIATLGVAMLASVVLRRRDLVI